MSASIPSTILNQQRPMDAEDLLSKLRRSNRERQARFRAKQSAEQRRLRQVADVLYQVKRRKQASLDQLKARRASNALSQIIRRQNETRAQSEARRATNAHTQCKRRRQETSQQSQARRAADALAHTNRRRQETPAQTEARRTANTLAQAKRRQKECIEQSKATLAHNQRQQQQTGEQRQGCQLQVVVIDESGSSQTRYSVNYTKTKNLARELSEENISLEKSSYGLKIANVMSCSDGSQTTGIKNVISNQENILIKQENGLITSGEQATYNQDDLELELIQRVKKRPILYLPTRSENVEKVKATVWSDIATEIKVDESLRTGPFTDIAKTSSVAEMAWLLELTWHNLYTTYRQRIRTPGFQEDSDKSIIMKALNWIEPHIDSPPRDEMHINQLLIETLKYTPIYDLYKRKFKSPQPLDKVIYWKLFSQDLHLTVCDTIDRWENIKERYELCQKIGVDCYLVRKLDFLADNKKLYDEERSVIFELLRTMKQFRTSLNQKYVRKTSHVWEEIEKNTDLTILKAQKLWTDLKAVYLEILETDGFQDNEFMESMRFLGRATLIATGEDQKTSYPLTKLKKQISDVALVESCANQLNENSEYIEKLIDHIKKYPYLRNWRKEATESAISERLDLIWLFITKEVGGKPNEAAAVWEHMTIYFFSLLENRQDIYNNLKFIEQMSFLLPEIPFSRQ